MSATTHVTGFGATSKTTAQEGGAHEVHNAFMIILYLMLRDIKNQADTTDAGLSQEQLLMSMFSNQNALVEEKRVALKALIDKQKDSSDPTAAKEIQAAMAGLQAELATLSSIRNQMNQLFKMQVDPAQQMIQQDSIMFGGILKSYLITQRTK